MQATHEWGEFFPVALSPFGYNETLSHELRPLGREEVLKRGWRWCDYETKVTAEKTIPASRLPDQIKDVPDDILDWAIECEVSGKPFKLARTELRFYREHNLPVPHRHPNQRHADRAQKRTPHHLWSRQCANCAAPIETSYSPDRPEVVYCEKCYLKTVY